MEDRGLEAALTHYIATLDASQMPRIQLRVDIAISLPAAVEQGLPCRARGVEQRVRHAHAEHCDVTPTLDSGELVLLVTDDGVGQPNRTSGIGITSMRSRVQALGGALRPGRRPAGGTSLRARIPVES